jgi:hypothetical protein
MKKKLSPTQHLDEHDLDFLYRSIESLEGTQVNRRTKKGNVLGVRGRSPVSKARCAPSPCLW